MARATALTRASGTRAGGREALEEDLDGGLAVAVGGPGRRAPRRPGRCRAGRDGRSRPRVFGRCSRSSRVVSSGSRRSGGIDGQAGHREDHQRQPHEQRGRSERAGAAAPRLRRRERPRGQRTGVGCGPLLGARDPLGDSAGLVTARDGLNWPTRLGFTAQYPIPSTMGTVSSFLATTSSMRLVAAMRRASSFSDTASSYAPSASLHARRAVLGIAERCCDARGRERAPTNRGAGSGARPSGTWTRCRPGPSGHRAPWG